MKYTHIFSDDIEALIDYDNQEVFLRVSDEEVTEDAPNEIMIYFEGSFYLSLDYYEMMDNEVHGKCRKKGCLKAKKAAHSLKNKLLRSVEN